MGAPLFAYFAKGGYRTAHTYSISARHAARYSGRTSDKVQVVHTLPAMQTGRHKSLWHRQHRTRPCKKRTGGPSFELPETGDPSFGVEATTAAGALSFRVLCERVGSTNLDLDRFQEPPLHKTREPALSAVAGTGHP